MWRLLKYISTDVKRVYHWEMEYLKLDPSDTGWMRGYKIQFKIFGKYWVTVHKYWHLHGLN